ncbi:hypothetical protein B0I35DRAFT_447419 [Stachybotrys elegans]|uniref:Chromo domain-containing protein n=1 Tax=Stachybotrys elegans TaxID=80388 RepID=A0A8K0SF24_9HYPO|nr:hypothetical protein B0I35DRAFT_447419 [Stachybotrys elegans]
MTDMAGAKGPLNIPAKDNATGASTNPGEQISGPKNDVTEITETNQDYDGEEHEVVALLDHRMVEDGSVDLLVHWAGESAEQATWEPEREIQLGAADLLYNYWQNAGGRTEVLFHTPRDAPPEVYHVFKVLHHEKQPLRGFKFQVQWVGYPASPADITVEPEPKLKKIAPTALTEYWNSLGGRNRFLKKKRNAKKL